MKKIIAIVGPTAVGKTKLSVELAKKLNGEIINADSCQIYQKMNIGTAKIKEEEKENIPHHLFDIKQPNELYTVYDYQKDARLKIEELQKKGKNIIFVGGTGLYLKSCLYQYEFSFEKEKYSFDKYSTEELYQLLIQEDKNTTIHPNNRKRIERALTKYWNHTENTNKKDIPFYDVIFIGLITEREHLYELINQRVDEMMEEGLLQEVEDLYKLYKDSKAFQTAIGYKEFIPFFEGKCSLPEVIEKIKQNSRKYAKRQLTFFRHQLPIQWFQTNYECFDKTIEEVYQYIMKEENK